MDAPFRTSASPSPVTELTPQWGDAATASSPRWRNLGTSFDPMNPLPPITTIFMNGSLCFDLYFSNQPMALAKRNERQLKCLLVG
jgi:hypothetical protein